jgi:putative ABC transport system permease protein
MTSRIHGVTSASAVGTVPGATVRRTDKIDPAETGGIAVSAARLDLLSTLEGRAGSGAYLSAATERYPAVVLGSVAADRLGIDEAGRNVYIAGRWFTVVGILDSLRLAPEIDRSALIGWDMAEKLGFDGHPTTLYERSTDATVSLVRDVLAATVNPQNSDQVEVSRPSDALAAQLATKSAFNGSWAWAPWRCWSEAWVSPTSWSSPYSNAARKSASAEPWARRDARSASSS